MWIYSQKFSEAISLAYSIMLDKEVKVGFTGKLPVKP